MGGGKSQDDAGRSPWAGVLLLGLIIAESLTDLPTNCQHRLDRCKFVAPVEQLEHQSGDIGLRQDRSDHGAGKKGERICTNEVGAPVNRIRAEASPDAPAQRPHSRNLDPCYIPLTPLTYSNLCDAKVKTFDSARGGVQVE